MKKGDFITPDEEQLELLVKDGKPKKDWRLTEEENQLVLAR